MAELHNWFITEVLSMFISSQGKVLLLEGIPHKYVDVEDNVAFTKWLNSDHYVICEKAIDFQEIYFNFGEDEWYPFTDKKDLIAAIKDMIRVASDDVQDMIYKFIEWDIPDDSS